MFHGEFLHNDIVGSPLRRTRRTNTVPGGKMQMSEGRAKCRDMFCSSPGSPNEVVKTWCTREWYLELENVTPEMSKNVTMSIDSKNSPKMSKDLKHLELGNEARELSKNMPINNDPFWFASMNGYQSGCIAGNDSNLLWAGEGFDSLPQSQPSTFFVSPRLSCSSTESGASLAAELHEFQEHHIPPNPPNSQHFTFAPTTLFLESWAPHDVGNRLVDFLTSEVVASVTKVRPHKYSIKAEVFIEGISCTIKVRVYNLDGRYAIEMQRRSGDAFVLHSTYRLLASFLEADCAAVSIQTSALSLPELEPTMEDAPARSVEVVEPILKMTAFAGLQPEAASALAAVAKGGRNSAAPLFAAPDEAASALANLLASESLDAVYLASQCVSALAVCGEAECILVQDGLLQQMALQATTKLKTTRGLVGTALAQAVADAVHCCDGSIPNAAARDLQSLLEEALTNERLKANTVASCHLERAALHLAFS